jgi:small subunit ribosomal protein S5
MDKKFQKNKRFQKEKPEFDQQIVDIARVTRVMAGGKRMRFRICLVIGDRKGRVGIGLAKGKDVPVAVEKAYNKAQKNLITVNMSGSTIPHEMRVKVGAAKIMLKPAPDGTGIIAGGACRIVLQLAGVHNVVAKIMGCNNKVNNVKATIVALQGLRATEKKEDKQKEDKQNNKQSADNKGDKKEEIKSK